MTRIRLAVCAVALTAATPSGAGTISAKSGKLPDDFPLPKGTKKGEFTDTGGSITGAVTVKDGSKAYDFWVDELDKAGYSITSKNKIDVSGTKGLITFSGNGYSSATITISDTNVAISLQK